MSGSDQVRVATPGFPRIGPKRALTSALERYWGGSRLHALELTKWFGANYHYLVPTLPPRESR